MLGFETISDCKLLFAGAFIGQPCLMVEALRDHTTEVKPTPRTS
ncbi:MAG: hypothetical protein V4510_04750 [bacterium]